ncbi:NAC domain-containing protein 79-like [Forsythia ovata]|uniref:NAC domain-containing protein 79-like n=1 Tax=Forsythia ovata TaxID=205694 RepID=A0ABD1UUF0_9LAMI
MDEGIIDGTKVVGFKQHLVFYQGKISSGTQTPWKIHEYRANPSSFTAAEMNDGITKKISNLVVCKIFLMNDDPTTDSDGEIESLIFEEDDGSEEKDGSSRS